MTVGVVVASYHYGMYLAHCLDSIFGQIKVPDDIVVVDDASHDMTKEVADKWGVKCVVREENMGIRDNFQDMLENHINTDLVFFLGADNWIHPRYVEMTSECINDKTKVVATDTYLVGEWGRHVVHLVGEWAAEGQDYPVWNYKKVDIMQANYIHGSALFDRKIALENGGFGGAGLSDHDMWRNFHKAGYELHKIDQPLLYYRKHRFNFQQFEIDRAKKKLEQ